MEMLQTYCGICGDDDMPLTNQCGRCNLWSCGKDSCVEDINRNNCAITLPRGSRLKINKSITFQRRVSV